MSFFYNLFSFFSVVHTSGLYQFIPCLIFLPLSLAVWFEIDGCTAVRGCLAWPTVIWTSITFYWAMLNAATPHTQGS